MARRGAREQGEEAHQQHVVASENRGDSRRLRQPKVRGRQWVRGGLGGRLKKITGTRGAAFRLLCGPSDVTQVAGGALK